MTSKKDLKLYKMRQEKKTPIAYRYKSIVLNTIWRLMIIIIILSFTSSKSKAQDQIYLLIEEEIWQNKNFPYALELISGHMGTNNYTASNVPLEFIYYKGVGYCCNRESTKGINNFDWIINNFNLLPSALETINLQKLGCIIPTTPNRFKLMYGDQNSSSNIYSSVKIELAQPGVTSVNTKGGNMRIDWDNYNTDSIEIGNAYLGEEPIQIGEKTLKDRRIKYDELPADFSFRDTVKTRLDIKDDNFMVAQTEHFMIAYFDNNDSYWNEYKYQVEDGLEVLQYELERSRSFLMEYYDLEATPYYTMVYLTGSNKQLLEFAEASHGLKLNRYLYGYSVDADQSIAATTPSLYPGTIKHELMHLLLNYNYTAMAPWLSEGIPAIYEVSGFKNGQLVGYHNWRGKILTGAIKNGITIDVAALVGYNWLEFNAYSDNYYNKSKLSVNHAFARYFCMYLDEQGKLVEVLKLYAQRNPDSMVGSIKENALILVEQALDMEIAEINANFMDWYMDKYFDRRM